MTNQFNVGALTIKKYVDIVYDMLIDKNNCSINTSIFFHVNF
jgi:predicted transcriptional regulator